MLMFVNQHGIQVTIQPKVTQKLKCMFMFVNQYGIQVATQLSTQKFILG